MSLILNFSQFFHHIAMAMIFKNRFNLRIKHIQIILTYVFKPLLRILTIKALLMVGILFFNSNLQAQDSTAIILKSTGDSLLKAGNFEEAYFTYRQTLNILQKNEKWLEWDKGFLGLEKAALKKRDMNRIDSLPIIFSVVPKEEKYVLAKCHYNTAYAYFRMGFNYQSIIHYEQALEKFQSLTDSLDVQKAGRFIPSVYNSLSVAYSRLGDQINAHKIINQGIEYSLNTEGNPRLCRFFSVKGRYYFNQNRNNEALEQYQKILDKCGEDAFLHESFAELYLKIGDLSNARLHLDRFKELYTIEYEEEPDYYYHMLKSDFYRKSDLHDLAIKEKKIGLKLLPETNDLRTISKELTIFSKYLYTQGKKDQSIHYAQKALAHFFTSLDQSDINSRPNIGKSLPDVWIIEALEIKAKYFRDKYQTDKNLKNLEEAKFYYDALFHYFDQTKGAYNSTLEQYNLGTYTQQIYAESIQFFSKLYTQEKNIEYFKKAFDLAQSANAFVLKNSISERKSLQVAGVPIDTINKFLQLKTLSSDSDEADPDAIKHLNRFSLFENNLKEKYPSLGQIQKDHVISLEAMQEHLDPNSIVVKYYYWNSILTRFSIAKNQVRLNEIRLPENFNALIDHYQKLISEPKNWDIEKYATISKTIYSTIIEDVLKDPKFSNSKHIIIAPDGPIKKIAFNSLVTNGPETVLQAQDYLIYDYEISYLYYCAQLKQGEISSKNTNGFIGFGIEYNDQFLDELVKEFQSRNSQDSIVRDLTLSPLKYAKTEAITSASILNGESILNEEATLQNVLKKITNFDLIHFSTHAFVDNEDYMNSFIALSKNKNEEYQFKYEDILNLNLESDFVVLSACQTSTGTNISGEGLMSLSRAFVQSGCKSTMGAYWNAPDLSTMKLMELFYSNLKAGMPKSKALRQAQIEYLTNEAYGTPRTRSPFFWSSWAIYGDNAPIPQINGSLFALDNKWMYILLGLIGVFLIFFFRSKLKLN